MPLREELLRFQHFGALQVTDLDREPLDRRCDHAKRREEHRVAVARDHLRRDRFDGEPHLGRHMRLDARVDVRERPDRARDRAGRDLLAGRSEPLLRAGKLRVGLRELEPEGHRLGMDGMRAADGRRHLVLEGAALERLEQLLNVGDQNIGGARELHVEARVEDVGRRHPLMHEARLRPDDFGQMRKERDHVVLGLALDLVDARDIEGRTFGLRPDGVRGLLRDDAELRHRIGGVRLDLEPDAETRLGGPRWRPSRGGNSAESLAHFQGLRRDLARRGAHEN